MDFKSLHESADQAGRNAVKELQVVPMVVGEETYPFSGVMDNTKPRHFVADGVCGFAWVNIKPGNSKFANWLKKNRIARSDSYYGGVTVWVSDYNQSMQKKDAYARAYAEVIRAAGVVKSCYAMSRLD